MFIFVNRLSVCKYYHEGIETSLEYMLGVNNPFLLLFF